MIMASKCTKNNSIATTAFPEPGERDTIRKLLEPGEGSSFLLLMKMLRGADRSSKGTYNLL